MAAPQLRVYSPDDVEPFTSPEPSVHIRLGDLLPIVSMAQRQGFIWLSDFLNDEVVVTSDLYDVLQTFRAMRPSA